MMSGSFTVTVEPTGTSYCAAQFLYAVVDWHEAIKNIERTKMSACLFIIDNYLRFSLFVMCIAYQYIR
jgi:hypothetical protein